MLYVSFAVEQMSYDIVCEREAYSSFITVVVDIGNF